MVYMYMTMNVICPMGIYFDVPHRKKPMSAKKIIQRYPHFAKIFDGESFENTLSFYYTKDKKTGVYTFIDPDDEEEVAELLGVKIIEYEINDDDTLHTIHSKMDASEIDAFKSYINDIRNGIKFLENSK